MNKTYADKIMDISFGGCKCSVCCGENYPCDNCLKSIIKANGLVDVPVDHLRGFSHDEMYLVITNLLKTKIKEGTSGLRNTLNEKGELTYCPENSYKEQLEVCLHVIGSILYASSSRASYNSHLSLSFKERGELDTVYHTVLKLLTGKK